MHKATSSPVVHPNTCLLKWKLPDFHAQRLAQTRDNGLYISLLVLHHTKLHQKPTWTCSATCSPAVDLGSDLLSSLKELYLVSLPFATVFVLEIRILTSTIHENLAVISKHSQTSASIYSVISKLCWQSLQLHTYSLFQDTIWYSSVFKALRDLCRLCTS